jgi:hypothetical protein
MSICPVLSKDEEVECLGKRCAWWYDSLLEACSVRRLAGFVDELQAHVPPKLNDVITRMEEVILELAKQS